MRKSYLVLFCLPLLCGCKSENAGVIRESVAPQVMNSDIMTTMPGSIDVTEKYVVWQDPFARDYFVHVHDRSSGKELGTMGKVGEGPKEFITGGLKSSCIDNRFLATGANGNTKGYLSIDSMLQHKESFVPLSESEKLQDFSLTEAEKGVFFGQTEDGSDKYFTVMIDGVKSEFGVYPIPEVKDHVGGYRTYNAESGLMAYCSFQFPYLALYKREGNTFKLQWEKESEVKNYEIVENKLRFDRKVAGIAGLCMSKDYIIALQRDREVDPMDESTVGRNAAKCPHTVFLYDYDSNLVKIVDLQMPIMRIAADRNSNTLYAIGVNPEFVMVKYEL
ncbi:hypothetical protein [uncultured Bacteroides sp.]|uniref:hypothetical protein n=1 Tax=uncultured Bacteroides sp. TaxID=162156 RepID=UPI0025E2A0C7|nr:hypothetical protein [uncultured Bacteroides sp.]